MAHNTNRTAATALPDQDSGTEQEQDAAQDSSDEDTKGTTAVSDVPARVLPPTDTPAAPAQPQVIVQMITPQAGEATEGLSEIKPGGEYVIQEPDGMGGYTKKRVNAEGQPLK